MATNLINCFFTPVQLAMDNVLKSFITEGNDTYKDGIWRMSSKFGTSKNRLISNAGTEIKVNNGKIIMVSDKDIEVTEDIRVNPLCDFKNSEFNASSLVAYADNSIVADTSDEKHGRRYITVDENIDADDYTNPVTFIVDAGKGVGTYKNIFSTIDCRDDITSGICCFQEFNLEDAQCYGFHSNIDGLTGEYEVILSNDSLHCQAIKNIRTGKLTYIEETDPKYNLVPTNFSQAVVIDDYIYYLGIDRYIHKINKTTLTEELKGNQRYDLSVNNLFTDGTTLYMSYSRSNTNSVYVDIGKSTLNEGTAKSFQDTIPEFISNDNYPAAYLQIASIDNGTKFVLYSTDKKCAIVFTNLSDIKNSILSEYTQFNIGASSNVLVSFALTTKGVYSFWSGYTQNDFGYSSEYSLKVCKNTSGQLFNIAEWENAFENDGNNQVVLTLCE